MNEYQEWLADFTEEQRSNYELCMKYPILVPSEADDLYNYDYTILDSMPEGWRKAFGEDWARELQDAVNKLSEEDRAEWCILDIKEKFGWLDQTFSGYSDDIRAVEQKYTRLSRCTCIRCGSPATKLSCGWVNPFCDMCAEEIGGYVRFIDIN